MRSPNTQQVASAAKKAYSAPRLTTHGSVAKLTAAKSGGTADNGGSHGQNLPPIKKYR